MLCVGVLLASGSTARAGSATPTETAYHAGKQVRFTPAPVEHSRPLVVGDKLLGPLVSGEKPDDLRRNLYLICPGTEYRDDPEGKLAFNLVLSSLPQGEAPVEWDVYWVVVLDPTLYADFESERDLLLAAQEAFQPDASFAFEKIPGVALLRDRLHIESIEGLERFRNSNGTLPQIVIVPSRLVVRAAASDPDSPSKLSGALSHLTGHKAESPSDTAK